MGNNKELYGLVAMVSLLIFALIVPGGGLLALPLVIIVPFIFFL